MCLFSFSINTDVYDKTFRAYSHVSVYKGFMQQLSKSCKSLVVIVLQIAASISMGVPENC